MSTTYKIGKESLNLSIIEEIIECNKKLTLNKDVKNKISDCREFLDKKITSYKDPVYGINTGFGSLCDHRIDNNELSKLQENLVLSHACGTGDLVPFEIVKIMMLLKIQSLSFGYSGVQLKTVNRLIDMFNNNIIPIVYQQGSLVSSGDLAPLAHMSLPLIGKGDVNILDICENGYFKRKKSSKIITLNSFEDFLASIQNYSLE